MRRLVPAVAIAILAVAAMAQPPQPGPWSEQPPYPQYPPYSQQSPYPRAPQPPQAPAPPGQPPADDEGNAPDRGVARISFMNGNVSVRRGDSGDLVAAIMNVPLTAGDRLVTGDGARAEVQFDFANIVRLGAATEVRFSELQYHRYQIQIASGTASFRILRDSDAQVELSTPSVSVHPLRKGIYRVTVKPDGSSEVTVRAGGESEISSPKGTEQLHSGKTMLARGAASDPEFQLVGQLPEDEFDHWSASRDHQFETARSPQYVNRDVYGAEDLDANGRWVNDGSYGNVWVPQVSPGWAPYQCGRWVWVDYYGWTWVGCESWGWAPYHYGRWYMGSYGWAWWPGPIVAPSFWRPALVGFFGFGAPGIGIGFGFGHVGWVPLAPFERFHAWYGPGFYAGRGNFNVIGGTNVAGLYRNARVGNGVTAMQAGEFGRGSVSSANLVRPSAGELAHAGMVRGALPVAPSRESTQFTNRAASSAGLPRTGDNTRFFSRTTPSAVNRVPFEQQRQNINQGAQRSPGNNAGAGGVQNGGGWRRADTPASQSRGVGIGSSPSSTNGGWQRFDPSTRGNAGAGNAGGGQGNHAINPGQARPGSGSQQPVRISPSIVQNRGNSGGNSGGGSAPRTSGGGGSRPSGGGGGGGHSGGGRH